MHEENINALVYAVRPYVVLKYTGQLSIMLAILTLAPLLFSLFLHDWTLVFRYTIVVAILAIFGSLLARLPEPDHIQSNEALTITTIIFLLTPLLMSWPMMLTGVNYIDILFESISAVTTTGLSTLSSIHNKPDSFLFARAWMQWYGGLGIIVLSVALFMGHQAIARRLTEPVDNTEMLATTARTHAFRTLVVYVGLTVFSMTIVWILSGNFFNSLIHTLSAISTGGFSSFDNSLEGFHSHYTTIVITGISIVGSISLSLYWRSIKSGWRRGAKLLFYDLEIRTLFFACVIVGSFLSILNLLHGIQDPWYQGFMMGISAQTTTGFSTQSVASMDPLAKLVMIISMFIGGSVGSTAGGIKLLRLLILLRMLQLMLLRTGLTPHAVVQQRLAGQQLETDDIIRALQIILLFVILIFLSWLPFVMSGYDPLDALFDVVSAFGTVGLTSGVTGPELAPSLKGILCFDMLAGRLEIIALLVVIYPRNWFGHKEKVT